MASELETAFSPEDRIRFLSDAWAMVSIGRLKIGEYLATLEKMQGERSRAVVEAMIGSSLSPIHDTIVAAADRPAFENWVRNFLGPMAKDLGETPEPGESDDRRALRSAIFQALAIYGRDPRLVGKSRALAESYMKDPASVDATLTSNALRVCALNGDASLYDQYLEHMKAAKTPEEYYNYFRNLVFFPNASLTKRTFDYVLSPAVKSQDVFYLGAAFWNYATQEAAWELFKTHFQALIEKGGGSAPGAGMVRIANAFCDEKLRDDSQKFLAAQNLPGTQRVLENAKDRVNASIQIRSLQQSNLNEYLKKSWVKGDSSH